MHIKYDGEEALYATIGIGPKNTPYLKVYGADTPQRGAVQILNIPCGAEMWDVIAWVEIQREKINVALTAHLYGENIKLQIKLLQKDFDSRVKDGRVMVH